jgi:hypothetical protein
MAYKQVGDEFSTYHARLGYCHGIELVIIGIGLAAVTEVYLGFVYVDIL